MSNIECNKCKGTGVEFRTCTEFDLTDGPVLCDCIKTKIKTLEKALAEVYAHSITDTPLPADLSVKVLNLINSAKTPKKRLLFK